MEKTFMGNSSPRVLIAASIYPPDPGGPAIHAKAQYERFPELGIKTGLVALSQYRHFPFGIRHLIYLLDLLKKGIYCDLIYAHDALGAGIPAYVAALTLQKKIIVRVGGDIAWERKAEKNETSLSLLEWYKEGQQKNDRAFKLSKWLLMHVDAIVVPSELLSKLYEEHYGVSKNKIVVIPNPIPKKELTSAHQENTIIYASRLVAYKNISFVLKSLVEIFKIYPKVKFIIMGDGPDRKKLEDEAMKLGIREQVKFLGSVSQTEVVQKTAACLFALGPALTEFNPNYILQTLSFGKPFLISKENGLPFAVPEEFLFNPRDKKEFEEKVLALLDSNGYKNTLHLVQQIDFKMSWEESLQENYRVITSLLEALK